MKANPAIPKGSSQPAYIGTVLLGWGKVPPTTEAAEIVRREVAVPDPGVMALGENEHFKVLGSSPQERTIGLLNAPDFVAAVTVRVPVLPARIVTAAGEAEKDSDGVVGGGVGGPGGGGVGGSALAGQDGV